MLSLVGTMKPLIFFFIVFASQSGNLSDNLITRLGFKGDYFTAGAMALVCAALIPKHHVAIIILASILAILASLPAAMTDNSFDRDYLYGLFIAVLLAPYLSDCLE